LESEFEVVDDIVYYFMIFDKSNDFRFCTVVGTEEGVYLIDFADHPGPAFYENILLAIFLINIYNIVRYSEHISKITIT